MNKSEKGNSYIQTIDYQPWQEEARTPVYKRFFVISSKVFKAKILNSTAVKILLLIGFALFQLFPILSSIFIPHTEFSAEVVVNQLWMSSGYWIFLMLFVSVLTADLISEDIRSNSFDLYFSRPIRPSDYFAGKLFGAMGVTLIYCLLPVIAFGLAMIGTQTGTEYMPSFKVLLRTIVAGVFATVFFLPFALMFSSLTQRKAYAGIGSFLTFFVLLIIGGIFAQFDPNWRLLNPRLLGLYSINLIMGLEFPEDINPLFFATGITAFLLLPLSIVLIQLYRVSTQ